MRLFSYFSQMVQVQFVTEQQHPVPVCPFHFVQNAPGAEQRRPVCDGEHHQQDLARHKINPSFVRVENFQRYPVIPDVKRLVV